MKFDAAATTPGCANRGQNGTEPSAKSIQSGCFFGSVHDAAWAPCGATANAANAATKATPTLFTDRCGCSRTGGEPVLPRAISLAVERRVDFGRLLGFLLLARRVLLTEVGRAAEVDPERREVWTVAAVGPDLLQGLEQRLALDRLLRHLLRRADLDRPVLLQTGRGRDQLADDHVLLQAEQPVDLALDRGIGQHLRRLLERGRRERGLRDPEDQRLEGRLLLLLLLDARVLAIEHDLVDELPGQELGFAGVLDPHLLEHLTHDQLDVLVVDVDALRLVDLLHLADEVQLGRRRALEPEQVGRVERSLVQRVARLDRLALLDEYARPPRELVRDRLLLALDDDRDLRAALGVLDVDQPADLGQLRGALRVPRLEDLDHARQTV